MQLKLIHELTFQIHESGVSIFVLKSALILKRLKGHRVADGLHGIL